MPPTPFRVHVADAVLADLGQRLERVRWPDEISGSGWLYGSDLSYVKELVGYWRQQYDWREHEAILNGFRQFKERGLHFIHEEGRGPNPLPLLLCHGWPGSVWEFHKIIPMLTDPARFGADPADSFSVVAPSLPGFGFSFAPNQPRVGIIDMADAFAMLMFDLRYHQRWGAHGGDWGSIIVSRLGQMHPRGLADGLVGIHLTMLLVHGGFGDRKALTPEDRAYLEDARRWQREEGGYQRIQGTKPQTLAYGLTDSPVGLAAWIVEKFRAWSDCGGDVERRFTKDELLTNIMLYWVTGAINSSFWLYHAMVHDLWLPTPAEPVAAPTAFAEFPREMLHPPRVAAERVYNVRRWTVMPAGGHFAALEEPEALAADIRAFFRELR